MEVSKPGPFTKLPFKKTYVFLDFQAVQFFWDVVQFSYALLFLLFLTLQYIVTRID